jgi:hypothetical protein
VTHCMIDIETLGTRPGAVILSIGVVTFDEKGVIKEWLCNVDLKSSLDAGLGVEAGTIHWWMRQSGEAVAAAFQEIGSTPVKDALTALYEFTQDENCKWFWSHGATFDLVLLQEAAIRVGAPPLFENSAFRAARDTRTLFEIADVNPKNFLGSGVAHKALDDARAQALAVIECWKRIRTWQKPDVSVEPFRLPSVGGVA